MLRSVFILVLLLLITSNIYAQPGNPGAPIGGGVFLIIGAVVLGILGLREKRRY